VRDVIRTLLLRASIKLVRYQVPQQAAMLIDRDGEPSVCAAALPVGKPANYRYQRE